MRWTLGDLAQAGELTLHGDPDRVVTGVATLREAHAGQLSFLANTKYRGALAHTQAAAVVLPASLADSAPCDVLLSDNPYLAFARLARLLHPLPVFRGGIHPAATIARQARLGPQVRVEAGAVIDARARLARGVVVGAGSYIGPDVRLGPGTVLAPRVTVHAGTRIGRGCRIHSGVVIGSDGFGMAADGDGRWEKVPQLAGVRIGDDVEIGANTTIDRGALEDTVIEDGVKLDNLIQVAHGVRIGAHTVIAGCVGISGSTRIGRHCQIAGGVGFVGHLNICDHVTVTGMSMVTRSIGQPGVYSGVPAREHSVWRRNIVHFQRLDSWFRRLRRLERKT